MTLGLTMVVIVLIGVMGAGLLTFVSTDLGTVIEVNRGQRAFEVADAGIGVAQRQLADDCGSGNNCIDDYDDSSVPGTQDSIWRKARGGVTLNDLDGDGDPEDNVHVTIDYRYCPQQGSRSWLRATTGGPSARSRPFSGGSVTRSAAAASATQPTTRRAASRSREGFALSGVSFYTAQDILIPNLSSPHYSPLVSRPTMKSGRCALQFPGPRDNLGDWDSTEFTGGRDGYWNTQGRLGYPRTQGNRVVRDDIHRPGFAALGKICGYTDTSAATCAPDAASVADGVYGYDSTTGANIAPLDAVTGYPERCPTSTDPPNPKTQPPTWQGNKWAFCEKPEEDIANEELNAPGTISFPFPRPVPNAQLLRGYATETGRYWDTSQEPLLRGTLSFPTQQTTTRWYL